MLGRRTPTTPSNEAFVLVPVFTPDPHGHAMFGGVIAGNSLGGARPVIDARGPALGGSVQSPQRQDMTGAGHLGGGRPVVSRTTRLDQADSLGYDPVQDIFEQRMAARRFS